jgi:hypothetical protein
MSRYNCTGMCLCVLSIFISIAPQPVLLFHPSPNEADRLRRCDASVGRHASARERASLKWGITFEWHPYSSIVGDA